MSGQKVRITMKEKFCVSLLHKYLRKKGGGINLDEMNQDMLKVVLGGGQVIAHITEDGCYAVSREALSGHEDYVMIGEEFIELESIEPMGNPYFKGKMYRLTDQDNQLGVFVKQKFNSKTKEVEYTIVTSAMETITGNTLVEMSDDELDLFNFGLRTDYYAKA